MFRPQAEMLSGSLLTVTALMAQGIIDSSLKFHLQNAKNHGVTQKEIAAAATTGIFTVPHPAVEVPGEETSTEWCEPVK